MRAVSLFSGAGGFEIGFERAGIRTVLQAESDPWCLEVLKRHWPEVDRVDDVRSVHKDDTPQLRRRDGDLVSARRGADPQWIRLQRRGGIATGSIDLVYGGFPCQDVSVAGKRAGLRGERSGLFYEFARVVRELRPRWFAIENVPGLLSSADGRDFGTILGIMVERGYGVAWRVLDGRWFGVPQRRRRVLVVGCLGDSRRAAQVLAVCESCGGHPAPCRAAGEEFAACAADGVTFTLPASYRGIGNGWNTNFATTLNGGDVTDTAPSLVGGGGPHGRSTRNGMDTVVAFGGNNTSGPIEVAAARSSRANRYDFDTDTFLVAETVRSHPRPGSNSIGNLTGVRRLTPLECERLMGWPDEWTRWTSDGREIVDSHRYRMCGNGVIAPLAQWLGWRLMKVNRFIEEASV